MIEGEECATGDVQPVATNDDSGDGKLPTAHQHEPKMLSACIKRAAVPAYFPQFRSTASLAHLAHTGRGPRYVLVGGQAWYEISDIQTWLEQNKRIGPALVDKDGQGRHADSRFDTPRTKRGRPTKAEQARRRRGP
jgi:hypothetical protein